MSESLRILVVSGDGSDAGPLARELKHRGHSVTQRHGFGAGISHYQNSADGQVMLVVLDLPLNMREAAVWAQALMGARQPVIMVCYTWCDDVRSNALLDGLPFVVHLDDTQALVDLILGEYKRYFVLEPVVLAPIADLNPEPPSVEEIRIKLSTARKGRHDVRVQFTDASMHLPLRGRVISLSDSMVTIRDETEDRMFSLRDIVRVAICRNVKTAVAA